VITRSLPIPIHDDDDDDSYGQYTIYCALPCASIVSVRLCSPTIWHLLYTQYDGHPQPEPRSLFPVPILYWRLLLPATNLPAGLAVEAMETGWKWAGVCNDEQVRVGV